MKKTKIVCTLGPATDDDNILRELIKSGMDCARFNFSHGTHEDHKKRYDQVERIRKELGLPIPTIPHICALYFAHILIYSFVMPLSNHFSNFIFPG